MELFPSRIAPYLSGLEIFRLRTVSRAFAELVARAPIEEVDLIPYITSRVSPPRSMAELYAVAAPHVKVLRLPPYASKLYVEPFANTVCAKLERLDLCCTSLTDAEAPLIAAGCPNIHELSILSCTNLARPFLETLGASSIAHSLRRLVLSNCKPILPLSGTLRAFSQLEVLSLNRMPLADEDVREITQCQKIEVLVLEGMAGSAAPSFADATMSALLTDFGPRLRTLSLSRSSVGADVYRAIFESCHVLKTLHLDGCPTLDFETVRKILTRCAHLQYLNVLNAQLQNQPLEDLMVDFPNVEIWARDFSLMSATRAY